MTVLLLITSALLLVSGAVKVRAALRAGLGVQILSLLELFVAVVLTALAVAGLGGASGGSRLVPLGVALMLMSSANFAMRVRGVRRGRAELEGARLVTYVKFLSRTDRTSDSKP